MILSKITGWFETRFGVPGLLHILFSKLIVDFCELFMPLWTAVLLSALAGLFKEFVYDRWMKKGSFEKRDFLADGIGIVLGLI